MATASAGLATTTVMAIWVRERDAGLLVADGEMRHGLMSQLGSPRGSTAVSSTTACDGDRGCDCGDGDGGFGLSQGRKRRPWMKRQRSSWSSNWSG